MSTAYKHYKPTAERRTIAIMDDEKLVVAEGELKGVHPLNAGITDIRSGLPIEAVLEDGVKNSGGEAVPVRFFEVAVGGVPLVDRHGAAVRFNRGVRDWVGKESDPGPQLASFGDDVARYVAARGEWESEARAARAESAKKFQAGNESRMRTAVLGTAAKAGPDVLSRAMSLV